MVSSHIPCLTLTQFEEQLRRFLIEVYQRTPAADADLSPSAKWEEGGFLPRMPESIEQLDMLRIEEVRPRRVRRDGIHFQGFRYLSLTLAAYVGEDVTIRYDPRDMAEIRVFHNDRFLCRAISAELAGETVPLRVLTVNDAQAVSLDIIESRARQSRHRPSLNRTYDKYHLKSYDRHFLKLHANSVYQEQPFSRADQPLLNHCFTRGSGRYPRSRVLLTTSSTVDSGEVFAD